MRHCGDTKCIGNFICANHLWYRRITSKIDLKIELKIISCLFYFPDAVLYNRQYCQNLTFDNFYITEYFQTLDARRKARHQQSLLPLRSDEQIVTIGLWKCRQSKQETKHITASLIFALFHILIVSLFVVFDIAMTRIMLLLRKHGQIDYHQFGKFKIDVQITGKSPLVGFLLEFLRKFETETNTNANFSNLACLPEASILDTRYINLYFVLKKWTINCTFFFADGPS